MIAATMKKSGASPARDAEAPPPLARPSSYLAFYESREYGKAIGGITTFEEVLRVTRED